MEMRLAALAVLLLAGCSTTPVSREAAEPATIHWQESQQARPGTGALVLLRDTGLSGSGCLHQVKIDGRQAATLGAGQKAEFHLDPGQHLLVVEFGRGLCPNVTLSQDVDVVAGATRTYRLLMPSDGSTRLVRID